MVMGVCGHELSPIGLNNERLSPSLSAAALPLATTIDDFKTVQTAAIFWRTKKETPIR
jgi:hypothetical protein